MVERVAIIGSGNWGSAIAMVIGKNVLDHPQLFHPTVKMWVYEETLPDGRLLSKVINTEHENVKYLPSHRVPENIVAVTDLVETVDGATILVFVLPHQFIHRCLATIKGHLVAGCRAVSLIKGVDCREHNTGCGLELVSSIIMKELSIDDHNMAVLMGANIADEVAKQQFCEATVGTSSLEFSRALKQLFELPHFRIQHSTDMRAVEFCGALKNVVAVAAGIVDGLGLGANTKAAVMRVGLVEMRRVIGHATGSSTTTETMFESCGVADLITTCYGGRNRRIGEALVTSNSTIEELEAKLLNGQKVQGPPVAREIAKMARKSGQEQLYPLMIAVNDVCYEGFPARHIIDTLETYPYDH